MTRAARTRPDPEPGAYPVDTGEAHLLRDPALPTRWTVWLNGVPSSPIRTDRPDVLEFEYLAWMAAVLELHSESHGPPRDLLHLGGGACALPWALEVRWPDRRQVVVELDGELARLVREWFDLPRSPRLRLQTDDARAALRRRRDASADVVVRDVFAGAVTPGHLTTRQFTADVSRVLRPGGLYLANVADRPPLGALRSEIRTVAAVFEHVVVVAETAMLKGRRYANAVVVASQESVDTAAMSRRVGASGLAVRVVAGAAVTELAGDAAVRLDPAGTSGYGGADGPGARAPQTSRARP